MISARHRIQTGSCTEAWKAGLTNEIQGTTVTRQRNVQTPPTHLATTILSQAVYISESYSNPALLSASILSVFIYSTIPFSLILHSSSLSLIVVYFPPFLTLPFP
jgi:hypothetical protein